MYEVVITDRVDFSEHAFDRYSTEREAKEVARRLVAENLATMIRARIRIVQGAKSEN